MPNNRVPVDDWLDQMNAAINAQEAQAAPPPDRAAVAVEPAQVRVGNLRFEPGQLFPVGGGRGFARAFNGANEALRQHAWVDEAFPVGDKGNVLNGKRGEELFQLILSGIREIYDVEATIAGGAVRDFASGCSFYKDVDVFVPMSWRSFTKGLEELGWQGPTTKLKDKGYPIKDKPEVGCMFPTTARATSRVQNVNIDLIFTEKPITAKEVTTFPVHAQRCVWTLEEGLVLSPEAKKDIEAKTFTIDPEITDKHKVEAVLAKINGWKKRTHYKDWTVVQPETKEWWEANE